MRTTHIEIEDTDGDPQIVPIEGTAFTTGDEVGMKAVVTATNRSRTVKTYESYKSIYSRLSRDQHERIVAL